MTTVTVIIVVLVVAALVAGAFVVLQKQRTSQLQERFGPEYDRAVEGASTRREAEQHLSDVAQRRDELSIRDLDQSERDRFSAEWEVVQARFVDEPGQAVDDAEKLVSTVMRERGYPVDNFDKQADLVAADHPDVVQHYRDAHSALERHRTAGGVDTEDLRQSFVHYRALFAVLVQNKDVDKAATATPVATDPAPVDDSTPAAGSSTTNDPAPTTGSTAPDSGVDPNRDVTPTSDVDSAPNGTQPSSYSQETR